MEKLLKGFAISHSILVKLKIEVSFSPVGKTMRNSIFQKLTLKSIHKV